MSNNVQRKKAPRGFQKVYVGMAVMAVGTTFLPSCGGLLTTVNPCGTVFAFCTAEELDAFFGSFPDYSLDPTCTIPYFGLDPANQGALGGCANINVYPTTPGPRPQGQL